MDELRQMQQGLGLRQIPEDFPALYAAVAQSWKARAGQLFSEEYLVKTMGGAFCLRPWQEQILEAAAQLREDAHLQLLVCLLEAWIEAGGNVASGEYESPAGAGLGYDFLHLFPAIPTMPKSVAHLRGRGVPEAVIAATMQEYDFCVDMCQKRQGRPAFDRGRLSWISRVIRNKLIRIGRFKYDLPDKFMTGVRVYRNARGELTVLAKDVTVHAAGRILGSVGYTEEAGSFVAELTETETAVTGHRAVDGMIEKETTTLSKRQWQLCLSEADAFPRIHIPAEGSFDKETVADSFRQAREVFDRCYPDYPYSGFFCSSWLMSTDLRQLLKPTSNILGFQSFFTQIPFRSSGRLVFSFVYGMDAAIPEDLSALPEDSSLRRAVKAYYQQGNYVHEGAGFFL